ncbi:AbrB/MazE/SpoVT family DNA-binding domain-containing protein [candidate division KSB1 bacterium]|nr:AbrB/MazE/SpoVT family DNA-binding domain-containing protein [candidate division KSB1 bacterium]MBL7092955.1 AbrB/MazE/SpoVT family DNA-binding domain-containing protein [candidate division KSB1 bacterium]
MQTKIQKWGNSQGLRFPKQILQEAQVSIGDKLNIFVYKGKIIIEPLNNIKNKYNIKELVSKMPKNYSSKELDWGNTVGKEEW